MKICFEKIKKDSKTFKIKSGDSYIQTYQEFLNYFDNLKEINKHDLIIGAHFIYGWMPTVLNLNIKNENHVLEILNKAKKGMLLTEEELNVLKHSINNSLVGVSKLLHFICPQKYAIWDSRVYKYIYAKNSQHKIQQSKLYLEYLFALEEVVKNKEFNDIQMITEKACGYEITPFRAVELIMFESGRK